MAAERLDAVDGLRAIAMVAVIAQHCSLLPFGWVGVWLFFLISGFVIMRGFVLRPPSGSCGAEYLAFMRRRVARIVPLYVFYLAICAAIAIFAMNGEGLRQLPSFLTFTYNYELIANTDGRFLPFAGHLWTLCVEQQFYLLFPLLVLLVPRRLFLPVALGLIVAGPFIRAAWSAAVAAPFPTIGQQAMAVYAAAPPHLDAFLMGAVIAVTVPLLKSRPALRLALWLVALAVLAAYCGWYARLNLLAGAQGSEALRNVISGNLFGQGREVFVYLAVDLMAAAVLVSAIVGGRVVAPLANPSLAYVGRVSYGGYVYHPLVLGALHAAGLSADGTPIIQRLMVLVIATALTIAVAGASYRWLERPAAAAILGRRNAARPAVAAA